MSLGSRLAVFAAAVASLSPLPSFADEAARPPGATKLTLINGWKTYSGSSKPEIFAYKGIVRLKGAIKEIHGSNAEPFVIPAPFRPAATVVIKLDLCDAANGMLIVNPDGSTEIGAENSFSDAQCFSSLDGVTYSLSTDGYHKLKLTDGWLPFGDGTAAPAARAAGNVVRFQGAMTGGSGVAAFTVPASLRPQSAVWIPLDMSGASNGRIGVFPDGSVFVQSEFSTAVAQAFTSLDGAYYAMDTTGFTALTLINGWSADTVDDSFAPGVRLDHGVVEFQGAITLSSGSSDNPFVLPPEMRPSRTVYVAVDMNQSVNGRLEISPNGTVYVGAESGANDPFGFVSLDGVSFHL